MRYVWALLAGLSLSGTGLAADIESLDAIRSTVRLFLEAQTAELRHRPEVVIGHLDSRLRLPACEEPLEAYLPGSTRLVGNTLVGVRCGGPKAWSIYVQAKLEVIEEVVVAARPLSRGSVIGPGDIQLAERELSRLSGGYLTDLQVAVGQTASRPLPAGTVLTPSLIELSKLVRRGDRVSIIAGDGGVSVEMNGEALADGAAGQVISVRNLSSGREIEAEVVGAGRVRVRF